MAVLYQSDWPDSNTDWNQLNRDVEAAKSVLAHLPGDAGNRQIIDVRYGELSDLANTLLQGRSAVPMTVSWTCLWDYVKNRPPTALPQPCFFCSSTKPG